MDVGHLEYGMWVFDMLGRRVVFINAWTSGCASRDPIINGGKILIIFLSFSFGSLLGCLLFCPYRMNFFLEIMA